MTLKEDVNTGGKSLLTESRVRSLAQNMISLGSQGKQRFDQAVSEMCVDDLIVVIEIAEDLLRKIDIHSRFKRSRGIRMLIIAQGGGQYDDFERISSKVGDDLSCSGSDLKSEGMHLKLPRLIQALQAEMADRQ